MIWVKKSNTIISNVVTSHDPGGNKGLAQLTQFYSKEGFTGIRQSHSHPDNNIPSGYYAFEKGNPLSLMPFENRQLDALNATQVHKLRGFENTIFEIYNARLNTITTYDGINKATIRNDK